MQKLPRELSRYLADLLTKRRSNSASKKSHKIKVESGNSVGSRAGKVRRSRQGSRRGFAIQKHSDGHLHYDLSLEMNQMLKSWSLAKQLPLKEGQKQNALAIAEQPIEYLDFERIAPKGPEGRGTSIVWDIGTYELIEGNYNEGFLEIYLDGSKLNGEWTLVRDKDDRKKWQLEKTNGSSRILPKRSE
ncbi:MAG TPA: DNA polymerase ligase N-terminal domain-containing protein [Pyrinomonadaceae bacterium]